MPRKKRTRSHIIADLSTNHVERFAILMGYSVERIERDYGYDLNIYTHDLNGEIENGVIYVQLKASDKPNYLKAADIVTFDVDKADLELWLQEPFPVFLVLYDAAIEKAYWVYMQQYYETLPGFDINNVASTHTVRINTTNIVTLAAMADFRNLKDAVLNQINGVISHV